MIAKARTTFRTASGGEPKTESETAGLDDRTARQVAKGPMIAKNCEGGIRKGPANGTGIV